MANVRQMPELYLRGSLANITMKGLTTTQRDHVEGLVRKIATHPDMQRHKIKFMKELSVTIAADYADDREIAEQELRVAIWRGVVDLFYHHKYTFECQACKSPTYMTKRSKPKAIDRIQTPCPNCRCVEISDPGDIEVLQHRVRDNNKFITIEEFQASYADMPDGFAAPTYKTTIQAIAGVKKYADPQSIIDDDKQLRKFFGEFVWNYFRQQINENKRKEHNKEPQGILGDTDWLLTQEVISLCNQMGVDYNFCEKTEPEHGAYNIKICGLTTPPEFTAEFARIRSKGELYGVTIRAGVQTIEVMVSPDATPMPVHQEWGMPNGKTKWIIAQMEEPPVGGKLLSQHQIEVYRPEHVSVMDNFASPTEESDNSDFTITQISYRTIGGERMDSDNHIDTVDNSEVMTTIRASIPDGCCKDVFDILSGQGDISFRFTTKYGDSPPKINHIAEFLGITARAVNEHKKTIGVHMHYNDFVPN